MLSSEQILALSPDDSSAKAAKGLVAPSKWVTLGNDDVSIWGECQGSGSKPYQVVIDVSGPTFKCTCPSRKFPCKHGLALYLLLAQNSASFQTKQQPPWVAEWLASRQQRAEKKAEKKVAAEAKPVDPAASAKREAKRLERMRGGARDLERWLADLIRHGIADLPSKPSSFWRDAAARLTDAQATGLAAAVRQLETTVASGAQWQRRALIQMGRIQLLIDALQRLETLSESFQHDVRTSAGWGTDKEDVLAGSDHVTDVWMVQGVSYEENNSLWERRVWLRGTQSNRVAMLLDFSHGGLRFETSFFAGMFLKAALGFFPSASPLRALLISEIAEHPAVVLPATVTTWEQVFDRVADSIARHPWLQRHPIGLHHAIPIWRDSRWIATDSDAREVSLRLTDTDGWQLLAIAGGGPVMLFGEWYGEQCRPLAAWRLGEAIPCWTEGVAQS